MKENYWYLLRCQISHDEHLITAVCDELWIIRDKKVHLSDVFKALLVLNKLTFAIGRFPRLQENHQADHDSWREINALIAIANAQHKAVNVLP